MKQKNNFDLVMDYIDSNIHLKYEELKKEIYKLIGYNSNEFGKCFQILTNITLFHYISARKLYFIGLELVNYPQKNICDIALEYGYSEQSALNRSMKSFYSCTPGEIRKGSVKISHKKYCLSEISKNKSDTRIQRIVKTMDNSEPISAYNMELYFSLEDYSEEFGFDLDICYQIADIAEKIDVDPIRLLGKCHELILQEEYEESEGISKRDRVIIECGIKSDEDLTAICKYFDCKYYDLDLSMVKAYYGSRNEN